MTETEALARHAKKYDLLNKKFGITITGDKWRGYPKEWWAEKLREDWALNNVKSLQWWDMQGAWIVGKVNYVNSDGEEDDTRRRASISDSVCCMKRAVTVWAGS
jgi:hypothetical protein